MKINTHVRFASFAMVGLVALATFPAGAQGPFPAGAQGPFPAGAQGRGQAAKPVVVPQGATPKVATEIPAEQKPFWDSAQAFVNAYAKHDADAIGSMFTEDAEFYDEFGARTEGREAIVAMFQEVFRNSPDALIDEIVIERVRKITDSVTMEEGMVYSSESPGATQSHSRYVALHTKSGDGKWRINSLKDFPRETAQRQEQLAQLAWMIGDWVNEDDDSVVQTRCGQSEDGNYLLRQFTIRTQDGREMSGVQRIGWDPVRKKLRSWTFDSEGGFFSGLWTKDGSQWLLTSTGVTAGGDTVTAISVYTLIDSEMVTWQYRNLIVAGDVRGNNVPVTMVKRPPAPELNSK